ncbi:MAG TPA: hypothetical protein VFO36_07630 [Nitrospiraceae bacterium]|nr:hypothetical protein [Nitrospiraceae bacterium]
MDEPNDSDVNNAALSAELAFSHDAKACQDDHYRQSLGNRHLAPHGGVDIAIMNMPAFLALIKS